MFRKMTPAPYPPRLWALVGYPGSGKSTFAAQMKAPLLVIDADHRFREVLSWVAGEVYELSGEPTDNLDPDRIAALLAGNMPGAGVATIVVDSLTAIITPLVVQAMIDKDSGRAQNLAAAFRTKALAMRQLQDAVTRWACDTLWVYHLNDARDGHGQAVVKATVSATELARLTRSINMQLELVQEEQRRGVKVVWARRGRSGLTLWDDSGRWAGMPEKIEAACYDGLTLEQQEAIAQTPPDVFPNDETAISWGFEQGAFQAIQHARNAYEKLKREQQPQDAHQLAALWVADVQRRLAEAGEPAAPDELAGSEPADGGDGDPGELNRTFPRFGDGTPVPDAALEFWQAFFQDRAVAPANIEDLRAWTMAQKMKAAGQRKSP